jgi:hypothetical protein
MKRVSLSLIFACALSATAIWAPFTASSAVAARYSYASPTPSSSFSFETINFPRAPNASSLEASHVDASGQIVGFYFLNGPFIATPAGM